MSGYNLSVIIPVYNQEKFLRSCLTSVAAQTLADIEVIVIDDGSTDQSRNIAREFEEKYSHFSVFHQKNRGRSAARNTGLDKTNGAYVTFFDSDDFIDPEMYEQLFEAAVSENAEVVKCGAILFDDQSRKILKIRRDFNSLTEITSNRKLLELYLDKKIDRVVWNGIYHQSLFENLRFPVDTVYEDQYVTPNVLAKTNKYICLPGNLYYYRKHSGSFTQTSESSYKVDKVETLNELFSIISQKNFQEEISLAYSKYFYKMIVDYHNGIIYSDPRFLRRNHYSIDDLIEPDAFEYVFKHDHLTQKEKLFIQLMRRSHYFYFLVQKLSRVKDVVLRGDAVFKASTEKKIDSSQINERYREMIKQYV